VVEEWPEDPDDDQTMIINLGPQHPSTHGVLRLMLELQGETVLRCKPIVGYLHTGMEKTGEQLGYMQGCTNVTRMDYLSPFAANVGFALAVEELLGIEVPPRCQAVRVLCCELARIGSHLLWLGTHALDLGAATVFFHTFKDREWHYDLVEDLAGARLTTSFSRIGGVMHDVEPKWVERLREYAEAMPGRVDEYESLLTKNTIWATPTSSATTVMKALRSCAECGMKPVSPISK